MNALLKTKMERGWVNRGGVMELRPPQACRGEAGAGSDHDGTRNMSRGVNLLYLFRYQIGGDFVSI